MTGPTKRRRDLARAGMCLAACRHKQFARYSDPATIEAVSGLDYLLSAAESAPAAFKESAFAGYTAGCAAAGPLGAAHRVETSDRTDDTDELGALVAEHLAAQ